MPIRSGAMQRHNGFKCGNTLRQRYDEVGLPCSSTMGSPSPTSTYVISLPRTRRRCFSYGNAADIIFPSPVVARLASRREIANTKPRFFQRGHSPAVVGAKPRCCFDTTMTKIRREFGDRIYRGARKQDFKAKSSESPLSGRVSALSQTHNVANT